MQPPHNLHYSLSKLFSILPIIIAKHILLINTLTSKKCGMLCFNKNHTTVYVRISDGLLNIVLRYNYYTNRHSILEYYNVTSFKRVHLDNFEMEYIKKCNWSSIRWRTTYMYCFVLNFYAFQKKVKIINVITGLLPNLDGCHSRSWVVPFFC